ncbi:hypothetical protein [Spirillospora albida]|uniref:hypothetical protein n=1 Tax=Spirillospora albida TaxID=58123 RepID=UPI0004C28B37|nr:hypothetical protein [Spirillospora albida]
MADPDPRWDPNKCRRGGAVPDFTGADIMAKLEQDQPAPLFVWLHDAHPSNKKWDRTYGLVWQVQHGGWTVHVVAHVHVKTLKNRTHRYVDGYAYIPGYLNFQSRPPDFAFFHVPGYDPSTHTSGWSTDPTANAAFLSGVNRYPV